MPKDSEKNKEKTPAEFPCIRCTKNVPNSCRGIICHTCKQWVHVECEPSITDEDYTNFVAMDNRGMTIAWFCQSCKNMSKHFESMFGQLKQSITEVGLRQKATDETVGKLEAKQNSTDLEQKKLKDRVEKLEKNEVNKDSAVNAAIDEMAERDKRESNVVFHTVRESNGKDNEERKDDDLESVLNILSKIDVRLYKEDIMYTARLGAFKRGGTRPLKVALKDRHNVRQILTNAKRLNDLPAPLKDVNITRDVTLLQRRNDEKVKEEVKKLNSEMTEDDAKNYQWRSVGRKGEKRPRKIKLTEEEKEERSHEVRMIEDDQETDVQQAESQPTETRPKRRKKNNPYS